MTISFHASLFARFISYSMVVIFSDPTVVFWDNLSHFQDSFSYSSVTCHSVLVSPLWSVHAMTSIV